MVYFEIIAVNRRGVPMPINAASLCFTWDQRGYEPAPISYPIEVCYGFRVEFSKVEGTAGPGYQRSIGIHHSRHKPQSFHGLDGART